ncbi:MAG TPA: peptidyl-prolyl cis-trans isomerase, partial [Candidatus Krumholzibacteria bacterium]|nr:peptidyl-prolyl cis-trans isomerase [Candidatus Krumholzibacteria bacterium]
MMKQMRENTKIILWVVVVAFVITIFAVWGLDLQSGGMAQKQNLVGRVNGVPITPQAYQSIYTQMAQQFRASSANGDLTSTQQEMLRDQAWESIVSNIITSEQIKELGITVSDEEVLNFIRTSPPQEVQQYFTDASGNFDYAAYQAALNNPEADWSAVEDLVRQRIPVVKLNQYLMSQVHVSSTEVRRAFDEETVRMTARYVMFPIDSEDVGAWTPSDEEVTAYYNQNQERFHEPEKASVQIVRIARRPSDRDRSDLAYTAGIVRKQAGGGEDFATLAKTYSESYTASVGGETGFLGAGQRDAAIMEALATMKPGDVSQPIPSMEGVYIVQLIASRKEKGLPQYNMREIYMKLTPGPETVDSLAAVAAAIREQAAASGDLAAAANARGLEVIGAQPFAAGMPIPGLGFAPAVSRFAFARAVGAVSDVIADDNNFFVCKVEGRAPAAPRPVAEVSDAIKQQLVREKKLAAAMMKAGAFRRSAAVPDVPFEKAAAQYQYTVAKTDSFTVAGPVADLGPNSAFAQAALSTAPGTVSPPVESGNAVYVIRVDGRKDPDEAVFQARAGQIYDRLYQERVQAYVNHWY